MLTPTTFFPVNTVGIAIGIVVGALIIAATVMVSYFLYKRHQAKTARKALKRNQTAELSKILTVQ